MLTVYNLNDRFKIINYDLFFIKLVYQIMLVISFKQNKNLIRKRWWRPNSVIAIQIQSYLDGETDIAMLSENVFVILDETKASDGVKEVCKAVRRYVDDIFSHHPDFSCYRMDDGHMLVIVGHVIAFSKEKITEEDFENSKVRFMNALALRGDLFEVCERAQVLAIVDTNENN